MKKVLLVEDEKNVILSVKACIDAGGYRVDVVEDGEEALNYVRKENPDIILLDLLLPKLDGFEVLKVIKNDPDTKEIPVIVLTAKAEEESRQRALSLGADGYMTKPFRPLELWDGIKNFLPDDAL